MFAELKAMSLDFQLNTSTTNLFVHYPYIPGGMQGQLNLHGAGNDTGLKRCLQKGKESQN